MKQHFTVTYNNEEIQVERSHKFTYILKYPDFKFIELDRNERGWVVEDRSGDYWSDEDIDALGALVEKNEPAVTAAEDDHENSGLPGLE